MADSKTTVTALSEIRHDDKTYAKGDTLSVSKAQAKSLVDSGVAAEGKVDVAAAGDDSADDRPTEAQLRKMKVDQVRGVAAAEGVEGLEGDETKAELITAIADHREEQAGVDQSADATPSAS
jgi:hypothetical protein